MAVLVKPNGLFGAAYMAAIKPFRYLFVYPAMLREFELSWQARADDRAAAQASRPRPPPVPELTAKAYRWVADHRSQLSRLIPTTAKRHARNTSRSMLAGRAQARDA